MNAGLPLRLKYVCGKHSRLIIASLIVLSALLFAGAAVAESPDPAQETVQTNEQRVATTLSASGEVTNNSALYSKGETVNNSPVYLLSSTPSLRLAALTTVPADRPVTVTQQVTLRLSVEQGGEVFWTDRQPLANRTQQVTNGTARTTTTLDVAALIEEQLSALEAETDGVGTVKARIVLNTSYDTGTYTGHTNLSTPLVISDRSYSLDTPRRAEQSHSTPVVRNVTADASGSDAAVAALGLPGRSVWLLFGGMLLLLVAMGVRVVNIFIGDFESFERRYEQVRYSEWVSRGRIPDTGRYARVPVEALVDLVDIAIDSDRRVIYDTQQEYYAVVDGNLIYEFRDESDAPGRMHEFGLAPVEGGEITAEQAFEEAQAATNGKEAEGHVSDSIAEFE